MTYVEFFDRNAVENIAACLTHSPERVILIGDSSKEMKRHCESYSVIFGRRGEDIDFTYKTTSKSDLENAVRLIQEIVDTYDDCVFDITGGEEILVLALGIVYAKNPDKNIQINRFNVRNNVVCDCDEGGVEVCGAAPQLFVDENIIAYGGDVVYGDVFGEDTYIWNVNDELVSDIEELWGICKQNNYDWNVQLGVFAAAERCGFISEDGLITSANISGINRELAKSGCSYTCDMHIVNSLLKKGFLVGFEDNGDTLTLAYRDAQVKRCLVKAGQVLEMRIFLAACSLTDDEGEALYCDAMNGVVIDWDGKIEACEDCDACDTENEMDVILMHDMVPVFISCKNGAVTSDELYKLNTVAERFGGKYAKKVLAAAAVSDGDDSKKHLLQRMKDMNIILIDREEIIDDAKLANKLKTLWK